MSHMQHLCFIQSISFKSLKGIEWEVSYLLGSMLLQGMLLKMNFPEDNSFQLCKLCMNCYPHSFNKYLQGKE